MYKSISFYFILCRNQNYGDCMLSARTIDISISVVPDILPRYWDIMNIHFTKHILRKDSYLYKSVTGRITFLYVSRKIIMRRYIKKGYLENCDLLLIKCKSLALEKGSPTVKCCWRKNILIKFICSVSRYFIHFQRFLIHLQYEWKILAPI